MFRCCHSLFPLPCASLPLSLCSGPYFFLLLISPCNISHISSSTCRYNSGSNSNRSSSSNSNINSKSNSNININTNSSSVSSSSIEGGVNKANINPPVKGDSGDSSSDLDLDDDSWMDEFEAEIDDLKKDMDMESE